MYKETVISNNETTKKVESFIEKFEHRVSTCPPGICPIAVQRSLLLASHAQTCGKCVPCRDGLLEVEKYITDILEGQGTIETYNNMIDLAEMIKNSADCAIGYEAAQNILDGAVVFKDEYNKGKYSNLCSIKIECKKVGWILIELQKLIIEYISRNHPM